MTAVARPRAVIFDWDNTLIDSWGTIRQSLNATLVAMGHEPWTMEETRERVRLSLRDSFPRLFGDRWEEARRIYVDTFVSVHLERLEPLPDAEAMLAGLSAAGLHLGVVSNKTGRILRREAEHLGWSRYFGRLVGATDATADKPDPAPVAMALADSGIVPGEEVWFVGDTALDMQCALSAGCTPILLHAEASDEPEFTEYPPRLRFGDCRTLFRYLKDL
jgi:phosphoglycolate phosphatase